VQHRRVSARFDQVGIDGVGEFRGELVGRGSAPGRSEELHLHELGVGELVGRFVDDRVDAVFPDPDGDVEVVRLLAKLLVAHTRWSRPRALKLEVRGSAERGLRPTKGSRGDPGRSVSGQRSRSMSRSESGLCRRLRSTNSAASSGVSVSNSRSSFCSNCVSVSSPFVPSSESIERVLHLLRPFLDLGLAGRFALDLLDPLLVLVEQHRDYRHDHDVAEQHERQPPAEVEQQRRKPRPRHHRRGDAACVLSELLC